MAQKFADERTVRFILHELLDMQSLTSIPYYKDHDRETFDLVVNTAFKLGRDMLFPVYREMDQQPPRYEDGRVLVHPAVREFLAESGEGGWIASIFPYEHDGQQFPMTLASACIYIFNSANFPISAYAGLTTGAANLILTFGTKELIDTYVPHMTSGRWQGTMALTEPQAGSSLSDVATLAEPTPDGHYLLKGQKIFISAGEHDAADNVVHLLLARIKGAPPGVKGISLFVVPKLRPEGGELVSNDLACAGIFHKMGYKGCPITHLVLGDNNDCRGYLVGEPHQGLRYMFQMMNEARLLVGMQATGLASAAYYASLEYAKERPQGRPIGAKDPTQPQVPLIEHADIKRMLLFQRSVFEGSLALILQGTMYDDLSKGAEGEDKERLELLLDLLTPLAKTFPSEYGVLSISQGLQILGGYGYCDEFPLEQYYRDTRIHPIHEGTTGIQGMDLLGRKVVMHNGRAFKLFLDELGAAGAEAREVDELAPYADRLEKAARLLEEVTGALAGHAVKGEIERFLADAFLYLEFFGLIAVAWQWLKMGRAAARGLSAETGPADRQFYNGKLDTMAYFFHYELPRTLGLAARLTDEAAPTINLRDPDFAG